MTRKLIIACVAALAAGPVLAQSGEVLDERALQLMDANGDGAITRAEMQAYAERTFAQLDVNRNGRLEPAETVNLLTTEQFRTLDRNGNGSLSRQEFIDQFMADFASADRDGDGILN